MALEEYEASLCACGEAKVVAWHSEMDGWYEHRGFVCHACTARQGRQVVYGQVVDTRPDGARDLPTFRLGVTTTPPDDDPSPAHRRPTRPTDSAIG